MTQGGDMSAAIPSLMQWPDRGRTTPKQRLMIETCFRKSACQVSENLEKWPEEYQSIEANDLEPGSSTIEEVQSDELDEDAMKECIAELAQDLPVQNGFCDDCQISSDSWPDLGDPDAKDPSTDRNWPGSGADWKHAIVRSCNTFVLEAAMRNGCRSCAFIMQMIKDADMLETFRKIEQRLGHCNDPSTALVSVQNWGQNTAQLLWLNFPGKVCTDCNSGIATRLKWESMLMESSATTYDTEGHVHDIANKWLKECSETHEECSSKRQNTLPTRLIFIAGGTQRVVLTEGWTMKPRYSTLSYRWGSKKFLKLTHQNYNDLLEYLPMDTLPMTFRDAITISRKLGIEYLWIDSLCIIQGSRDDWKREAALMSSVYGGSFISIAASSAQDADEGCLLKPDHVVDGIRARICVKEHKFVREFRSRRVYEMSTTKTPLMQRGWAVQEKILPTRTIHFTDRGAFWECKVKTANQFLPGGFPDQLGNGLMNQRERHDNFPYWWSKVVQIYSAATLTFIRDKLPAILGTARESQETIGSTYLAGMWKEHDLEAHLCWSVHSPQHRPAWRAPSWSWMSVDGAVSYKSANPWGKKETLAHVLDVEMKLATEDSFGEILEGILRIACHGVLVARYTGESIVKIVANQDDSENGLEFPISLDCSGEWPVGSDGVAYILPILDGDTGSATRDNTGKWIKAKQVCGLVLQKEDGKTGWFHRIGTFELWTDAFSSSFPVPCEERESFLGLFEQHSKLAKEGVFGEVLEHPAIPDERYILNLH